jgi:catechol-2,3-dioxygenase
MIIEHIGISVSAPISMAEWYVQHLGFTIRRSRGDDQDGVAFISDPNQEVMLELFNNTVTPPLDSPSLAPLTLHIAVKSPDPAADVARLERVGAKRADPNAPIPDRGDILVLLRDPWGNVIQLAKREKDI